jgi:hypothetical protein
VIVPDAEPVPAVIAKVNVSTVGAVKITFVPL